MKSRVKVNTSGLLLALMAASSFSCGETTDEKMSQVLKEKSSEFHELAKWAREDFLDHSLSRVSAHELMDEMGRGWSVSPAAGDFPTTTSKRDSPAPPIDRARFLEYFTRMAAISVSRVLVSENSIVLEVDGPSFSNGWIAKSYFVGKLSSFESVLPFESRWPTIKELSTPRMRNAAYKRLDNGWYIELRYFSGFL